MFSTKKYLSIGLDPVIEKLPSIFREKTKSLFEFGRAIIDATYDLVVAYKPNSAFYEAWGATGIEELKMIADYLRANYPQVKLILDAKRGDIGHTNEAYGHFAFDYLKADALTLHPYLGKESVQALLKREDKFFFILCKTSNPGSGQFQDLKLTTGRKFYEEVALKVAHDWNTKGNCGLVVGATYPNEVAHIRELVGDGLILLTPGVGKQGGNLKRVLDAGRDKKGKSIIVPISRSITYPPGLFKTIEEFKKAVRSQALSMSSK